MRKNRGDGQNPKLPVLIQPNIGLESDVRQAVVKLLNIVLTDEVVLTSKTRCACWNVRGADFLGLRSLFETQYQEMNNLADEIAERVRILGGFAIGSLEEFIHLTRLEEQPGNIPASLLLLANHETAIRFLRGDARKCSEEYEDEGTFALLVKLIRQHEKMAWMLRSYLETESSGEENQVG